MRSPELHQWSAAHGTYVETRTGSPVLARSASVRRGLMVRAGLFLLVFTVLQISWELSRGGAVEHLVVHDATVRPAAALIRVLTPAIEATADGYSLKAFGGGLNILNGCEGVEAVFLLLAAFVITPMPWRARLTGVAFGIAFLFAVNQLRVVILFYAWRTDPRLFANLHGLVMPIAMTILIAGYYYAWLAHNARRTDHSA